MDEHIIPDPLPFDRRASGESFIIYQTKVMRRYSALVRAMQVENADETVAPSEVFESGELDPRYAEQCKRALGLHEGQLKYLVRKPFAAGGMGSLYYVRDRDFRRTCVMKVIMPQLRENDMIIRSFVREARITGQLEHPNIIPVHDLGYHTDFGLYFTMKLVEGETLNDILHELETGNPDYMGKYDLSALLGIFRKICDAVAFAHSRGIIHRDIKPRNVMVGDYGEVLLMDWGLAKAVRRHQDSADVDGGPTEDDGDEASDSEELIAQATAAGASADEQPFRVIKGSPGYMSPEQASGHTQDLDQRSDVFLLGATLYNILSFFPPYIGEDVNEVLDHARRGDYMPLDQCCPGDPHIPTDLVRIVHKAMAPTPARRYRSVDALIRDIDDVIHGRMKFHRRTFQAGEFLVRESDVGNESYIIERGQVEVFKMNGDRKVTLSTLGAGEIVGEMALITRGTRSASVQAVTKTRVFVLTDERFTENLRRLPTWMEKSIVALARRLYEADQKLTQQQQRP